MQKEHQRKMKEIQVMELELEEKLAKAGADDDD